MRKQKNSIELKKINIQIMTSKIQIKIFYIFKRRDERNYGAVSHRKQKGYENSGRNYYKYDDRRYNQTSYKPNKQKNVVITFFNIYTILYI
jgi:hypothetical protein